MKQLVTLCALLLLPLPLAGQAAPATTAVPRDGKFEASFTLAGQTGNPFDPRDNDVDVTFAGPQHRQVTVPAFWDGDRWRVRYAPTVVGAYALRVSRNGQPAHPATLSAGAFRCVPSREPGFVRRDPKAAQRFDFDSGQPYYPLGMDVAWTGGSGPDYPVYFAAMGQAHMNWARVWMNHWDGKNLEWAATKADNPKIGTYLLAAARRWDMIFDEAARNGVYVQMTLQHHGQYTAQVDPNWGDNPFNAANGGFLKQPGDFFTDPEARRLTKAKYRYIVARWGYATHLLSYELFNEVQNIGEMRDRFQDVVNWHKEMEAYLRSIDTNHHLITTSFTPPDSPLAQIGLDYDQPHTYPPDVISTFAGFDTAGVATPIFYGEWGLPGKQTEQGLHDGLWAGLTAPSAGAQQFWYWDQVQPNGWWPQYASATGFVRAFGVAGMGGMSRLQPAVTTSGARADLSFAPPGDWDKTTVFDVTLDPDGGTPRLAGITPYIQGTGNRDLLTQPIAFHLNAAQPCRFVVALDHASKNGAHPVLTLDGKTAAEADYPAAAGDTAVGATLAVDVPAGAHTVSVFNTGPDWYLVHRFVVTGYAPAVAALARGDAHHAVFWVYNRDRDTHAAPQNATVTLPGLAPGRYTVRLWDTWNGRPAGLPMTVRAGADGVPVSLNVFQDAAGVVTPAP